MKVFMKVCSGLCRMPTVFAVAVGNWNCLKEFHNLCLYLSMGGSEQNVKSFWTPVSESIIYALSHGSLGLALHGSFFNHFLIGWFSSTANKNLWNKRLIRLPWRTKCRLPCERAWKTVSETCVKSEFTFCLRPPIEKTNSGQSSSNNFDLQFLDLF